MRKAKKSLLVTLLTTCLIGGSIGAAVAAASAQVPASFTITGAGFGHGIGMSQYGAQGMALDGNTAAQILTHYYPGTSVDTISIANPGIRVGLYQDKVVVALRGEVVPGAATGGSFNLVIDGTSFAIAPGAVTTLTTVSGLTQVTYNNVVLGAGTLIALNWVNNDTVINIGTGTDVASAKTSLGAATCIPNACSHRFKYGTLEISSGTFDDAIVDLVVVNTLRLTDEYLFGLGEVPSSWADAAMQAQAIAGRSYAINKTAPRLGCNCQIYSSIVDQAFIGYSKEIATSGNRWKAAVQATIDPADINRATVVQYNGSPITTYYSSSTGGMTQPSSEVWGSALPYLVSVADPWSQDARVSNANSSWTDTIDQATLLTNLRAQGVTIADVLSMTVAANYPSGGIKILNLSDSAGNVTSLTIAPAQRITPDELRGVLGTKSTYISAITPGVATIPSAPTTPAPAATNAPSSGTASAKALTSITKVNWPSNVIAPTNYAFTGKVSPTQNGATVKLQRKSGGKWKTVSTATTNDKGAWSILWSGPSAGKHDLRITATNSKGTIKTSTNRVTMVGSITASAPKNVKPNSNVTLSGSVKPGFVGAAVVVQRKVGNGAWKNIGTVSTDASGNWAIAHNAGSKKVTISYRAKSSDARLGVITSKTKKTQVK